MRLTPLGLRELLLASLLGVGAAAPLSWLALRVSPWCWAGVGIVGVAWMWVLWFFRDPERTPPGNAGDLVSPADGRVSDITPLGPESDLGCEGQRIGIFMNICNVHVNRIPCDGRVVDITHRPGVFLDVRRPEAYERNESATIRLLHSHHGQEFPVVVRQIAGLVARRIVTTIAPGDDLQRGARIGMIKFGSRLELLLPAELTGTVRVRLGERVLAGQTVLFSIEEEEEEEEEGKSHG